MDRLADWLQEHRSHIIVVTALLLVAVLLQRSIGAVLRRWRPAAPLHPSLQKYGGKSTEETQADRDAAARIIATSSRGELAGYEIVRQIEAVFVEGHRTSEEAVAALKSAAGHRGANAILNLSHQRTAAGRCTAQGDAVLVRPRAESGHGGPTS